MKVLLIAIEFPPIQAAGAVRALRFAVGLPAEGVTPIIVCGNPVQLADDGSYVHNLELADQVPPEMPIYYLDMSAIEPGREPLDLERAAASSGVHCFTVTELLDRISDEHDVDAIWATCPPFHIGPLARAAKARLARPLVIDMRDAWSQWGSAPFRTWFQYRGIVNDERKLLCGGDAVVCVTPQLLNMERAVCHEPSLHFSWIPNAASQLTSTTGKQELILEPSGGSIRIGYAGQFYYNPQHENERGIIPWYRKPPHRWLHYYATRQRWIYRTPFFFFQTWCALKATDPDLGNRMEFHYVGPMQDWLVEMAREFGLEDQCVWYGTKPKAETQRILEGCGALLSTSIKVEDGEDYCLASKTFDYINAGRPVLGFVSPGSQRDFLEASNIAVLFDPDNVDVSAAMLAEALSSGIRLKINGKYLQRYSSETTVRELACVFSRLSSANSKLSSNRSS